MKHRKYLVKSLKNELWNFMVDTHAYCTHFIIDRSINVSCGPVAEHDVYGPARDTVLTNRQTEKLNFDTNYNKVICVKSAFMHSVIAKKSGWRGRFFI